MDMYLCSILLFVTPLWSKAHLDAVCSVIKEKEEEGGRNTGTECQNEKKRSGKLLSQRNTGGWIPVSPRWEFLKCWRTTSLISHPVFLHPLKKSLHVEARLPSFLSATPRWRRCHRRRRRPICLPAATAPFIKLTVGSGKGFQVSNTEEIVNISPRWPARSPSSSPSSSFHRPLSSPPGAWIEFSLDKKAPPVLFNLPSERQPRPASQTLPRLTLHPPPVATAAPHIVLRCSVFHRSTRVS